MTDYVLIEKSAGILTLTLNRPERKNSLHPIVCKALGDAIDAADEDDEVRCILVQSTGNVFSSGGDLEAGIAPFDGYDTSNARHNPLLNALTRTLKPLVAGVQGHAVGGGATMLLHFDMVFIAEDARLTVPFAKLGVVPEIASSMLLPQHVGHMRAFSMFVLGEPLLGREAVAYGLANAAMPAAEVAGRARAAAEAIAEMPPTAVRLTKMLMRDREPIIAHMNRESDLLEQQCASDEAKEAFAAFVEKRKPNFLRA